jgi:D-alanyl-lipoteichoic acid acyltransferase DltB (MBOAT superfamily)
MLFNSLAFIFFFFPIAVIGFFAFARRSQLAAASWLGFASLAFYGWWDYRYVPLLVTSIVLNYLAGGRIAGSAGPAKRRWLVLAIAANLGLLGYYKYAEFFVSGIAKLVGTPIEGLHIVLPLGISFFTFTQIAFLVDTFQGKANERRFVHYVLFVTYFPHLIAGPVLHHKEMMPQFSDPGNYRLHAVNVAVGSIFFFIGLAKKVLIADNFAPYAGQLFGSAQAPTVAVAWAGVLAYTFQLYFDFSGYSDMAVGLSRVFGIRLPLNFNSPYKASDISDFWRRWHMTLSRFLRDYLYIPLGGNRDSELRRYLNLMITMLLGGLWHGAGWTFILWGGLHGIYLVIHQVWGSAPSWIGRTKLKVLPRPVSLGVTFIAVCFAWVLFRSPDIVVAIDVWRGMIGCNGFIPDGVASGSPAELLLSHELWISLFLASGIVFLLPNTQELAAGYLERPRLIFPLALGIIAAIGLMNLSRPSEFLYFNF